MRNGKDVRKGEVTKIVKKVRGGQDKKNKVGRKRKDDGGDQAQLENKGIDVTSNYKANRSENTVKS